MARQWIKADKYLITAHTNPGSGKPPSRFALVFLPKAGVIKIGCRKDESEYIDNLITDSWPVPRDLKRYDPPEEQTGTKCWFVYTIRQRGKMEEYIFTFQKMLEKLFHNSSLIIEETTTFGRLMR